MKTRTMVLGSLIGLVAAGAMLATPPRTNAAGAPVLLGSGPLFAYTGSPDFTLTLWGYNLDDTTVIR
jgi:hypothetical protein